MMQKIVALGFLMLLILTGCAPAPVVKNPTSTAAPGIQSTYPYTEKEYRLQVGDQLDVKFFYNPELNEQVIVRPDGRISLQLVREIMVAGMTPAELNDLLTKKYGPLITRTEITVIVRSFSSQRIYVDGEVNKAGMINLTTFTTVIQAISQAGGVKDSARTTEVIVVRRGADNKPLTITVNLNQAIDGTDTSQDIVLRPFDIVYVPKSSISNVNKWVDLYIRKNLPVTLSLGYYPP
jgi:polysaccharide biosynthesis/export protein